ncbi:MAG: restriction endonuclease subunit S [Paracoccaceae bacterium]
MSWVDLTMAEICSDFKYGKMPPKDMSAETGYPVYSGYRISGYAKEYLYEQPQLILVARGVGGTGDVKISPPHAWITNLSIVLSLDETKMNKRFLYYKLGNEPLKERLNTGAAQAQITVENLKPYRVSIPDLPTQERIAAILSAYDDLIENNRRRIALLEQATRLLYREWFVHFRFPGHETAKFVDGLPEGWARTELSEVCSTNKASHKKGKIPDPVRYIDIGSVSTGSIDNITEYMAEDAPGRARRIAEPMDTIWSNVRPNLQAYSLVMSPKENDVFSTGFTVLHAETVSPLFLYLTVTTDDFVKYLTNHATGASYPAVRSDDFDRAEILVPSDDLMKAFHEFAEPIFRKRQMLGENNAQLSAARDFLLPRLMDGRLPV